MTKELTPGQKRAQTNLKNNPNYYRELGKSGGKKTQKLHKNVANFRDKSFAKQAGLKGLKAQGKA